MKTTYRYAVTRPIDFSSITIEEGYWKAVRDKARDIGLPRLYRQYEARNVVKNFIAAATDLEREPYGEGRDNARNFDEFLFKALEAGAYYLADPAAAEAVAHYRSLSEIVRDAQQPDGYIVSEAISLRLKHFSPEAHHEMYNAGHLMQAGIAELRTSGERVLFETAKRYVDLLIRAYSADGAELPRFRNAFKWPDHPNLEMALVELYRVTGEEAYLDFCGRILSFSEYPARAQLAHHAVQEILHATGAADYYLETGSSEILSATRRLWSSLLKKVYISGGVGNVNRGSMSEAAGKDFELTNTGAYSETCAAVSLVFWSWRMFLIEGTAAYIDMLERALYNGVQAGIAANGYEYFYENPLEYRRIDLDGTARLREDDVDYRSPDRGGGARTEFHRCSCCPPNVQRLFASLQQYIYSLSEDSLWVNLFINSAVTTNINGANVAFRQRGSYPQAGSIKMRLQTDRAVTVTLRIRIPGWCDRHRVRLDGAPVDSAQIENGYLLLEKLWQGDTDVELDLPLDVQLVSSHPRNTANYAKVAFMRGPLLYCLEQNDHPDLDIFAVVLPASGSWICRYDEALLGGMTVIEGEAFARDDTEWDSDPYKRYPPAPSKLRAARIRAVPYYAWANRGRSSMLTALPVLAAPSP